MLRNTFKETRLQSDVIRGLFIDLDGTLADSINLMGRVFQRFLQAKKIDAKPSDFSSLRGRPLSELIDLFRRRYGLVYTEKELIDDFYDMADDVYIAETRPMPGAGALLEAASRCGAAVVVVTSARGTVARGFLERHDFARHVRGVVAAEDVELAKPDPQPYLRAMALVGVAPALSLAVEDSAVGARAALAAGLPTWIMDPHGQSDAVGLPGLRGVVRDLAELATLL